MTQVALLSRILFYPKMMVQNFRDARQWEQNGEQDYLKKLKKNMNIPEKFLVNPAATEQFNTYI